MKYQTRARKQNRRSAEDQIFDSDEPRPQQNRMEEEDNSNEQRQSRGSRQPRDEESGPRNERDERDERQSRGAGAIEEEEDPNRVKIVTVQEYNSIQFRLQQLQEVGIPPQNPKPEEPVEPAPKKKNRRKAAQMEMDKKFYCLNHPACLKRFGSRSSVKNHIKIKYKIAKETIKFRKPDDRGRIFAYVDEQTRENVNRIH